MQEYVPSTEQLNVAWYLAVRYNHAWSWLDLAQLAGLSMAEIAALSESMIDWPVHTLTLGTLSGTDCLEHTSGSGRVHWTISPSGRTVVRASYPETKIPGAPVVEAEVSPEGVISNLHPVTCLTDQDASPNPVRSCSLLLTALRVATVTASLALSGREGWAAHQEAETQFRVAFGGALGPGVGDREVRPALRPRD